MELTEYREHSKLKAFVKTIPSGTILFKQGQLGRTMFILLEGAVSLVAEREGHHIESVLEAGQILGERAIIRDVAHARLFTARAKTDAIVLELGLRDVEQVQKAVPHLMTDILKRAFQVAADRLAKANYMIRALRSSDNLERLVQCIRYFCRTSGKRTNNGIEVEISAESIYFYIDMELADIKSHLSDFVKNKVIVPMQGHLYQVPDENALIDFAHRRREIAA